MKRLEKSREVKFAGEDGPEKQQAQKDWILVVESLVCLTQTKWDGMDVQFDDKAMSLAFPTFKDRTTRFYNYAVEVSIAKFTF